jgi:FkbM family methyltransferase
MIVPDWVRRFRLLTLMARQLENGRDVWRAYSTGRRVPPLHFRNGIVIDHRDQDGAGFLFLEIFANGCYRTGMAPLRDGVVVDLGANIGAFTIDCAVRYPTVRIHAYEPDPETFEVLRRNITTNNLTDRVVLWNEAVAGGQKTMTLWRGDGSMVASAHPAGDRPGEGITVPCVTLQIVLERCGGSIALLKLDVEGSEAEILEAAGPVLAGVEAIVAEYHPQLVPDVVPRLERALKNEFNVQISTGGRCGPMLRARKAGVR